MREERTLGLIQRNTIPDTQKHLKLEPFDFIEKPESAGGGSVVKEKICLDLYGMVVNTPRYLLALRDKEYMREFLNEYFIIENVEKTRQEAIKNGIQWNNTLENQAILESFWVIEKVVALLSHESNHPVYGDLSHPFYVNSMHEKMHDYTDLGEEFVEFIQNKGRPSETVMTKDHMHYELDGLMTIAAMAKILGDSDWLGNKGAHSGFIIKNNKAKATIIRAVDALTDSEQHIGPDSKDIQIKKDSAEGILFDRLTTQQKEEFLETLYMFTQLDNQLLHTLIESLVSRGGVFNTNKDKNGNLVILLRYEAMVNMVDAIITNILILKHTYQEELAHYQNHFSLKHDINPLLTLSQTELKLNPEDVFFPDSFNAEDSVVSFL